MLADGNRRRFEAALITRCNGETVNSKCLSAELVETLQQMIRRRRPIGTVIENLATATLPGLVEFGCLRYGREEEFPALPDALCNCPLGIAIKEVPTRLGLRVDGPPKVPVKNLDTRPIEFQLVSSEHDLDEDVEWLNFLQRFERSVKLSGFSDAAAANLQSALHEMAENAQLHSQSPVSAIVGYEVRERAALFSVADVGIGVLASLRTNPLYDAIVDDVNAIQLALRSGVTCRVGEHGGLGFNSVFKALAEQWGQLRFRSGNGCITMSGVDVEVDKSLRHRPLPLPGFQVSVCCRTSSNAASWDFF